MLYLCERNAHRVYARSHCLGVTEIRDDGCVRAVVLAKRALSGILSTIVAAGRGNWGMGVG